MNVQHATYNQTRKDVKYQELAASKKEVKQVVGEAVAFKYKYNCKEWQDELGVNLYNMDMRQYDPAIARWTSIDPVVHHSESMYSAFDNNPIYWADPSGTDPIYNWDTGQYVINGQVVSFEEALEYAQNGGNADGSNDNTPSKDTTSKNVKYKDYDQLIPTKSYEKTNSFGVSFNEGSKTAESSGPPYKYNGKTYQTKAELFGAILLDQTAEQFGIKDLFALAAALDGTFPSIEKVGALGSGKMTSYASKYGSKLLPQKMPFRLFTHIKDGHMKFTRVLGRFLGRWAGPIGWALLAYDVGATLYLHKLFIIQ